MYVTTLHLLWIIHKYDTIEYWQRSAYNWICCNIFMILHVVWNSLQYYSDLCQMINSYLVYNNIPHNYSFLKIILPIPHKTKQASGPSGHQIKVKIRPFTCYCWCKLIPNGQHLMMQWKLKIKWGTGKMSNCRNNNAIYIEPRYNGYTFYNAHTSPHSRFLKT